jgi:hypothetical protein
MNAFTREPTRELTTSAQAFLPLVEAVRVHRVNNKPLALDSVALPRVARDDASAVVVDVHNGLIDVDARLSLPAIAKRAAALGYWLPVLRPLPSMPLWRVAPQYPFYVDAVVQSATLISVDGDVFATPRGPRHSAGPSMLHATTTAPPFAFLVRARLKVTSIVHSGVEVVDCGSVDDAARALRDIVDDARVFGVEAFGSRLLRLGGAVPSSTTSTSTTSTPTSATTTTTTTTTQTTTRAAPPQTPWATAATAVRRSRSLPPGDLVAIREALHAGQRVCAVPFMQRVAALDAVDVDARADVKDVRAAAQAFANALRTGATRGAP